MWKTDDTTREQATEERYRMRYESWQRVLAEKHGVGPQEVPGYVVARYVIDLAKERSVSTWRQYRAAILAYHELNGLDDYRVTELLNEETLRRRFAAKDGIRTTVKVKRTSANKAKGFTGNTEAVVQYRLQELRQEGYKKIPMLSVLEMVAISGARPVEIMDAKLVNDAFGQRRVLVIKNAKATNGRANGEYRTLIFDAIGHESLDAMDRAIRIANNYKSQAEITEWKGEDKRSQASKILREAFKRWFRTEFYVWLKNEDWKELAVKIKIAPHKTTRDRILQELLRVTLYTFRHQMFAHAKSAFREGQITLEEIAALGGHSSIRTHQLHYARSVKGRSGNLMIRPTRESVANVSEVSRQPEQRPHYEPKGETQSPGPENVD